MKFFNYYYYLFRIQLNNELPLLSQSFYKIFWLLRMRWPWVGLNSVAAPFTAQKFVVFTKLSSRNHAQCIVVHVSSILKACFFLTCSMFRRGIIMQTKTLKGCEHFIKNLPWLLAPSLIFQECPCFNPNNFC